MIARVAAPLELGERGVVRQELGVHVQLADATGDELGELAAEIEDDDRSRGVAAAGAGRSSAERSGAGAFSAVSR